MTQIGKRVLCRFLYVKPVTVGVGCTEQPSVKLRVIGKRGLFVEASSFIKLQLAGNANGKTMAIRRKDDPQVGRSWFRTERVTQEGGQWFFHTREGTLEGPFKCRMTALNQLETYVRLASNDYLDSHTW